MGWSPVDDQSARLSVHSMKRDQAVRHWLTEALESPHALAVVLVLHVVLLLRAAWSLSPTYDEPAHLASGISYWQQGHTKLYRVNTPLVRAIAALPAIASGATAESEKWDQYETTRPEFPAGTDLLQTNQNRSLRLFLLARLPIIGISVLGAFCCGSWANERFGPRARFIAVTVWCTHPLVLGHGALITADVAAATTGIFAARLFAQWLRQPLWGHVIAWGLALGISLSVKSLWGLLAPGWLVYWAAYRIFEKRPGALRELLQFVTGCVVALIVVNSVYLWDRVGKPLGELEFRSRFLTGTRTISSPSEPPGNRFRGTLFGTLPVPIAADYLEGMDLQRVDFEGGYSTWFLGEKRKGPVHEFYPTTLILKTPVGMIAVVLLALLFPPRLILADKVVMIGVATAIVATLGLHPTVNHVRYALPLLPFLAIWVGGAGSLILQRQNVLPWLFLGCLAAGSASSVTTSPWHLSYLNEFVRPGKHSAQCLVDSQTDWGQGLIGLKDWLDQHPEVSDLKLAYFGTVPPAFAGITFELPPTWPPAAELFDAGSHGVFYEGPCAGWYAVSGSLLVGGDGRIIEPSGRQRGLWSPGYRWLMDFEPVDVVGGSIFLFHLSETDAERIRSQPRNSSSSKLITSG